MASDPPSPAPRSMAARVALLVGIGAGLGALSNGLGPRRIPWFPAPPDPAAVAEHAAGDILTAGVERLVRSGAAVLVDARREVDYEAGHIPGALSYPLLHFDEKMGEVLPRLLEAQAAGRPIVVYCEGGECESSKGLIARLEAAGIQGALLYAGGWQTWTAGGHPVERDTPGGGPGGAAAATEGAGS